MSLTLEFYELRRPGQEAPRQDMWITIDIPAISGENAGTGASTSTGTPPSATLALRPLYAAEYQPHEVKYNLIPSSGKVELKRGKTVLHTVIYDNSKVPAVRSSVAIDPHLVRLRQPTAPQSLQEEYPGYTDLPDSMTVQMNPTDDPYVVYFTMRRGLPDDVLRNFATGEYYIWYITHAKVYGPPASLD